MSLQVRNLDWLRRLKVDGAPEIGARLHEMVNDLVRGVNTLESQTNANLDGQPAPPPAIQGVNVVPHPQGVDISIQHDGNFYEGLGYYVDYADNPHFQNARTQFIGDSRNHILPVGNWGGYYQVRAKYPTGVSTAPVIFGGPVPRLVKGGSVSTVSLLPTQGAGTTRRGQPPGFGSSFRSANGAPPVRGTQ